MGEVYLAVRDDDQFHKQAAAKLIRVGMDSPEALARFLVDRQILADLEHPNLLTPLPGRPARTSRRAERLGCGRRFWRV
jgi:hypothetical protein